MTTCDVCGELCDGLTICDECRKESDEYGYDDCDHCGGFHSELNCTMSEREALEQAGKDE